MVLRRRCLDHWASLPSGLFLVSCKESPGPKVTQNCSLGPRGAFKEASERQKEDKQQVRALGQLGNESPIFLAEGMALGILRTRGLGGIRPGPGRIDSAQARAWDE